MLESDAGANNRVDGACGVLGGFFCFFVLFCFVFLMRPGEASSMVTF